MTSSDSVQSHPAAPSSQSAYGGPRIAERASPTPGEWQPIETAPFEDVWHGPNYTAKWLTGWFLFGRQDQFGWVEWVGSMDADMWLGRDYDRACSECDAPTHWMPLPPPPAALNKASPSSQENERG